MSSVLNLGEGLDLINGKFLEFRTHLKLLYFDDLDCYSLVCLLIDGAIDLTELSLPYDIVEYVVFNLFAHAIICLLIINISNLVPYYFILSIQLIFGF